MNGFDIRYRLEMDYDLFLRCYRNKIPLKIIDKPFSVMRSGGVSTRTDSATLNARLVEERAIHYRNCPSKLMKSFYNLYWQVYPNYKLTRGRYDRHRAGKPE
jgi:hypothetical protein